MLVKCLAVFGLACLAWRFLPLLALLVIFGVVQRCLFFTWRYLALLAFAGVACRSCTLPFANALSVLWLARFVGDGKRLDIYVQSWTFLALRGRGVLPPGWVGWWRIFFKYLSDYFFDSCLLAFLMSWGALIF